MILKITKKNIQDMFDNQMYEDVLEITNPYINEKINSFYLLYYLKSLLVLENFVVRDKKEIKKIFFYYFYLKSKVEFDNDYTFYFNKKKIFINFKNFEEDIKGIRNFKSLFILWKNKILLNRIVDLSIWENIKDFRKWAIEVDNILDFFMVFTKECSDLYIFSWEHYPLFKWLINKLNN